MYEYLRNSPMKNGNSLLSVSTFKNKFSKYVDNYICPDKECPGLFDSSHCDACESIIKEMDYAPITPLFCADDLFVSAYLHVPRTKEQCEFARSIILKAMPVTIKSLSDNCKEIVKDARAVIPHLNSIGKSAERVTYTFVMYKLMNCLRSIDWELYGDKTDF